MIFLKKKRHEYDVYIFGLVLAKSKNLLKYVSEHPRGADFARKKLLEVKYLISRLNPILRGFFIRALHNPLHFHLHNEVYLTSSRDVGTMLKIKDTFPGGARIQYKIDDRKIYIDGEYLLSENQNDMDIFISLYNCVKLLSENTKAIDFNIEKRKVHEKYDKKYTEEYP